MSSNAVCLGLLWQLNKWQKKIVKKLEEVVKVKFLKWMDDYLEEFVLIVLLIIMTCSSGLQVVMRYVFNNSLVWSEEVSKYAFIWSGFLSIGYCIKKGLSIKIDILIQLFPPKLQKILSGLGLLVLMVFFGLMIQASLVIIDQALAGGQTSPALHVPMAYVYCGPIIGFVIAIFRIVEIFVKWLYGCIVGGKKEGD